MEENIVEVIRSTAANLHEMMLRLAAHVEYLEQENAALKEKLKNADE